MAVAPGSGNLVALDVAAQLIMVTPRWVQKPASDGWFPKADRGMYSLIGVVQAYEERRHSSCIMPERPKLDVRGASWRLTTSSSMPRQSLRLNSIECRRHGSRDVVSLLYPRSVQRNSCLFLWSSSKGLLQFRSQLAVRVNRSAIPNRQEELVNIVGCGGNQG